MFLRKKNKGGALFVNVIFCNFTDKKIPEKVIAKYAYMLDYEKEPTVITFPLVVKELCKKFGSDESRAIQIFFNSIKYATPVIVYTPGLHQNLIKIVKNLENAQVHFQEV